MKTAAIPYKVALHCLLAELALTGTIMQTEVGMW